jgi:hypothetical protein
VWLGAVGSVVSREIAEAAVVSAISPSAEQRKHVVQVRD